LARRCNPLHHCRSLGRRFSPSTIQAVYDDITHNCTYALRELDPDSGAYFNEADPFEPDWQWQFFGKNYERLKQVKERWDAKGVFWCKSVCKGVYELRIITNVVIGRSCVGSEE
jgi:hypothetical protein